MMAATLNLGDAILSIVGDSSRLEASIARLQGTSLSRLRSVEGSASSTTRSLTLLGDTGTRSLTRVQSGFGGLLGILGRVTTALGGVGFVAAGTGAIRLAANLEQAEIAFSTMLGSGEKAQAFLDNLASFAASTPFEFTGLQQSSRLLLAFGFQAENILPIMGRVGDAVAALGGGEFEINRVVRALGQMQTKGKVSAEELNQLAEIGVGGYEILREKLGLTAKEVANIGDLGIDSATAISAILEGLGERYSGAMAAQSQTLNGLFSTARDNIVLTLTDLGTRAVDALNLKEVVRGFIDFTGNIRSAIESGGIGGLLGEYKDRLGLIAATIAGPLTAALAGMAAGAIAAAAPFVLLAAAGAALYTAWSRKFLGLHDLTDTVFGGIRDGIGWVLDTINGSYGSLDAYKARWGEAFTLVGQKANEWYSGTRDAVNNSLDALREGNPKAAALLGGLGEMFGSTVKAIGNAFVQLPNYIIAVINSTSQLGAALRDVFGPEGLGRILSGFSMILFGYVVEPFQNLVEPVAQAAAQVGQVVSNWATRVTTFFKPFTDFLKSIGRSIGDAFGDVAKTTVSGLTSELKSGIDGTAQTFQDFHDKAITSMSVTSGVNAVADGWSTVKHAAEDGAGAVLTQLEAIQANSDQAAGAGTALAEANTEVAETANTAAQGAITLASSTSTQADAADTATNSEKALQEAVKARTEAATVWTTRLNDEVTTGSKTAAEAAELILPVYDRVKANMARMLESGVYDGEEYLVAKGRLEILEQALTTFLGTPQEITVDVKVNVDTTVQDAKDFVAAQQEAANSAAVYDSDGTDALSEALARAVTQSGYMTEAQQELNLEQRDANTSAESLSGTLAGLNERSRIAGQYFQGTAAEASDLTTEIDRLNASSAAMSDTGPSDFSTSLGNLNTLGQYATAQERAADAKAAMTEATDAANRAIQDEGDLVGQTKEQLDTYIASISALLTNLMALAEANPQLAQDMGLDTIIGQLEDARDGAEQTADEVERLSQTEGGLRSLGVILDQLSGIAGGGTFAGMLGGLSAGATAAAGEVQNINDGLKAIGDGDFSGGISGIAEAAQTVLGAIKEGFEQVLGHDLPAEANIGFEAVNGALGGAAAGAIFGPWGAVIGGVLGGIMGLFGGIQAEQKKWTEEAKKTAEALGDSMDALSKRRDSAQRTDLETDRITLNQQRDSGAIDEKTYFDRKRNLDNQEALLDQSDANLDASDFYNTERDRLRSLPQTAQVQQQLAALDQQFQNDIGANQRQYDAQIRQNNTNYSTDLNDYNAEQEENRDKFKVKAGSVEALQNQINNAQNRQKSSTSAAEYDQYQQEIDGYQAQLDAITGEATKNAIKGSLDWYENEISKLQERQGAASTPKEYADLQRQIDTYDKQMDKIKGVGAGSAAGSIAYYNEILKDKQKAFDETTDAGTRAALGGEIAQLKATIDELERAGEVSAGTLDQIREAFNVGTEDFASSIESAMHAADYESFTDNFQEALRKKITDAIIQGQNDADDYQVLSDMTAQALSDGTVTQAELNGLQSEADRVAESKRGTFELLDSLTLFGDKLSDTAGGLSAMNAELTNVPSGLKLDRMRYAAADAVPDMPAVSVPSTPSMTSVPDTGEFTFSAQVGRSARYVPNVSTLQPSMPTVSTSLPDTSLMPQGGMLDISSRLETVLAKVAENSGVQIQEANFSGIKDIEGMYVALEKFKSTRSGRQTGSTVSNRG